jgi:ParB-like chromosome segregation protein Spo0J
LRYRLEMVAVAACLLAENIRQQVVDEEIRLLSISLKKRQVHPIFLLGDGRVIDGGKRVRAAMLAGITELLAVISDEPLTASEIVEIQVVAAFHRSDPSNFDKFQAMEAVKEAHTGWTTKEMAAHLDLDPKMIRILLSPGQCIPEVRDALRDNRIGISVCHELSLLPPEDQLPLLTQTLAGASRDAIAKQARQQRRKTAPSAERVKNCKFARSTGCVVTLSGIHFSSLTETADELTELAAEMRKAEKVGTTIKTFMTYCRERVEAGV